MRCGCLRRLVLISPVFASLSWPQSNLVITTTRLPPASVGISYSATVSATGGMLPYMWSVNSGQLPSGLTLDPSTGAISGIPTTPDSTSPSTGTVAHLPLIFAVRDANGTTVTANLPISVAAPVTITTASLPQATVGVPYFFCLSAQGGYLFYAQTWTVTSGALPPGLSMSPNAACGGGQGHAAAISGTATQAGNYSLQIQVEDFEGRMAAKPFTLAVAGGQSSLASFAVMPPALSFADTVGGAAPGARSLTITSGGPGELNYTAAASASWIALSTTAGSTPSSVSVTVNPAGLAAGSYSGSVTVTAPGAANGPFTVPVTLTITAAPMITAASGPLSFTMQAGGSAPPPQNVAIASSGAPIGFTAASSAAWLTVSPASSTTPSSLQVLVNPAGLATGSYSATITVTASGAANSPQVVSVSLTIQPQPPAITAVSNAASGAAADFAPGSIISIFGSNLGPAAALGMQLSADGSAATSLGGYSVLFDGAPAPLLLVQSNQINTVIPMSAAGNSSVQLQVEQNGTKYGDLSLPLTQAAPALFTADGSGHGQGAILNQDMSLNSAANPAAAGSVIVLYATGGGLYQPRLNDGTIAGTDLSSLVLPSSVQVAGASADILYAGSAPGLIAGAIQINVRLPGQLPAGNVPIVLSIGNSSSQAGVTIAVR
jgi:uncharacterized protein (TIGR03437 family)